MFAKKCSEFKTIEEFWEDLSNETLTSYDEYNKRKLKIIFFGGAVAVVLLNKLGIDPSAEVLEAFRNV